MQNITSLLLNSDHNVLTKKELIEMPPLALAFVGDAVYELYIRSSICIDERRRDVNYLHRCAVTYVKAQAQATVVKILFDELSEEEKNIVKRGRNAHPRTVPKNASISDYRYATGFEALLGYLYYSGNNDRLMDILEKSYKMINNKSGNGDSADETIV
ncbi:MAG: Mini-ribonuclease 3 [Ruminococcaceae bacterium]|nr:Mini-ribonuclease 3 [Oscillospiraceae bacterium]